MVMRGFRLSGTKLSGMRWSKTFIPTLRDNPVDADAASHRLLLRAGYVRQLMAGHYSILPLGMRVRERIINVIREEMNGIGAQEFLLPTMHPVEIWEKTGRRWGFDVMFTLTNKRDEEVVLGPTHEEIFTTVFHEVQSYKELPQIWYQFQTKYRDEPRAKGGLLRVREFTMKDAYSYDIDDAGLHESFEANRHAYDRIFKRLGIPAMQVQASNGSMGGKDSIEFMSPGDVGEDDVINCTNGDYAANVERAVSTLPEVQDESGPDKPEKFATPGVRTIADLESFEGGAGADRQIKTLVYVIDGETALVLLRGDHELVEQKLIDATGTAQVRPAHEDEIKAALGASPGSLGAVGVTGLRIIADEALRARTNMTTGANVDDFHLRGVNVERDIEVESWASLRRVRAGEACPVCGAPLEEIKSIEIGHIFKLGRKFTEALGTTVLNADGKPVLPIMGCYGIGVERAIAAIVERHHDDKGIVWPISVAPFAITVVALNFEDEETMTAATKIYDDLCAQGISVLFDDRKARPGVKLSDAELVGMPWRLTVGKRGLANGVVELTSRATGETSEVPLANAVSAVRNALSQ